jgi:hypothetical protein
VLTEAQLQLGSHPTLRDVSAALVAVYGTDVAWVGDLAQPGLADALTPALTTWFGPPAA